MQQADQPGESTQPSLADKTKNPKRIFFSYGHDGNRELVDRFKVDLEKRGHTVWIDYKDIGAWDDWKSRITQGIHDSQMAIAFLSMHSTRDPGVCRNEMAMALNHFGTLYPILLEKLPMGSIPLTITHLQWPDLSSWRALKDGPDPAEFERFYQEKLLEIVSRIEGEETRFASEADALRRVLLPSDFDGKFAQHLDGFIGREWVCEEFEKWRDKQPKSRVFWLKAGPGFGKTALAVQLASKYRATIVGTWFCDSQSMQSCDPVQAVRTLAFQLAIRWDDYRTRLLAKLGIYENSQPEQIREAWTTLAKKNLVDTFRHLLVEPMSGLIWREHKLVVMLDGLDEATQDDGKNLLASLISKQFLELPPWICFVVTSRPEASVVGHLQRFNPFEIQAHDKRNMADLERYAQAHIATQPQLLALKPAARKTLCNQLLLKAEGMILYLRMIAEGLQEGIINVDGLATMQAGLGGLHSQYFQTFEHRFGEGFQENVQPLLRLLLAAPSVLPVELAAEVLQWKKERLMQARLALGSYLVETPAGMGLFHKTLGEWLQSEASGMFFTDASEAALRLGEYLWTCFEGREQEHKITKPFRWESVVLNLLPKLLPCMPQWSDGGALNNLANLQTERVRYEEALPMYVRALAISEKSLGKDHPDVATSLNNLALLYSAQGHYAKALPMDVRALAIREKALGKYHLDVAQSLNNLAGVYDAQGDYPKALPMYVRALAINEKALGKYHPSVATSLNNLASLYYAQGDYAKALPMFVRALAIREKELGKNHPDVATSLNNLAGLYKTQSEYEKALPMYIRALAINENVLGKDHPSVATSLSSLAGLYDAQSHYSIALPIHIRALAIREKALGKDHRDVATSLNNLALLYSEQGHYSIALPIHIRALAIYEKALGKDHPKVAASLCNLAGLYCHQGDYAKALPMYVRSLAISEKALGKDHPDVATILNNLALVYDEQGDYEKVLPLYVRALAISEKALGKHHPYVANSLNNLATLYYKQSYYTKARPLYVRALAISEKALGKYHPEVAISLNNLALLYDTQGAYEKALPLYVRALAISEKALGKNHPSVGISLNNYADCLEALGKTKEAAVARARVNKIKDRIDRESGK